MQSRSTKRWAAVALTAAVGLAGCGGSTDSGGSTDAADETGAGALSGAISIDGSSTVAPISEAVAEEFRREESDVRVAIGTSGTGGGFTKFCNGEIDIADASRPIKDEEKAACAEAGVEYLEMRVGLDGLAVVTSAENDFLECLSFPQLASIFREGGAGTWDQVDPDLPKEPIAVFGPGTDSGTYDFFVEEVLGEDVKPRADYTASEDDNTLVQGIAGERSSWGYFGFAYFAENRNRLKAVAVAEEEGGSCVTPSDETVADGSYPLSRPLFIYVKKSELARPEVEAFARFYLEVAPALVGDVGYTAAPAADYEKALAELETAVG